MKFSKEQLQEQAKDFFKKLGVTKLHATSDGQFFENPNRADLHSGGKMAVYELHQDGSAPASEETAYDTLMNSAKEALAKMSTEEQEEAAARVKAQREQTDTAVVAGDLEAADNTSKNSDISDIPSFAEMVDKKIKEAQTAAKEKAAIKKLPNNSPEKRNLKVAATKK